MENITYLLTTTIILALVMQLIHIFEGDNIVHTGYRNSLRKVKEAKKFHFSLGPGPSLLECNY